jgi:CBS-domain-containing membrane protein
MLTVAQNPLKRPQELLVADVMTRGVAVIPETAAMDEAADILTTRGGSGAPVVDHRGRCIGVLSTADFMRIDVADASRSKCPDNGDGNGNRQLPWNSVQRFMSTPVHSISPAAPMMQAAEQMCAAHIHRLIVLDDRETPVGLVSTLDVVSALVHAVDEDRLGQRRIERRNGE